MTTLVPYARRCCRYVTQRVHTGLALILVAVILGLASPPARAQSLTAAVLTRNPGDVKADEITTFAAQTQGGIPPYEYVWVIKDSEGRLLDRKQIKQATLFYKFPAAGDYKVTLTVYDKNNNEFTPAEISVTAAKGTPKPRPPINKPPVKTVGPTVVFQPLQSVSIFGPSKVKAGKTATWEGGPVGGAKPWHFRWRIMRGNANREVTGNETSGLTNIARTFTTGPVTITLTVWDNKSLDSAGKPVSMTSAPIVVEVESEKPAVIQAQADPIAGDWLWVDEKKDEKGRSVRYLRPVYINPAGSDGIYHGVYFPYLDLRSLAKTPDKSPSHINFKKVSGNTYNYVWNYPSGIKGKGQMTFTDKSAQGTWQETNTPGRASGQWRWGRPDATAQATLSAHFGR